FTKSWAPSPTRSSASRNSPAGSSQAAQFFPLPQGEKEEALADLAETAARLCKADLVSATVGEFPEVQGIAGGHLALSQGLDPRIAAAIRDHYKPVGPSDKVPTAPVTVAVALADKLDTLYTYLAAGELPTGSRDPFALRRAGLGIIRLIFRNHIRTNITAVLQEVSQDELYACGYRGFARSGAEALASQLVDPNYRIEDHDGEHLLFVGAEFKGSVSADDVKAIANWEALQEHIWKAPALVTAFLADRLKVQQREAGVRPDIIDAVFALGGEDDLVRLLARVKAVQAVLLTPDGSSLLAGYRRGTNMLRIEELKDGAVDADVDVELLVEPAEIALNAALDAVVPEVAEAVAEERFESAMTALARLRPSVDSFFNYVTVNAGESEVRRNRLALLARLRTAVHSIADFSKITD
ncbi:MAG: glycine--tRNA ligase subunit beta, partial [Janthinobacterium lividum]